MFKRYSISVFILAVALTGLLMACGSNPVATATQPPTVPPTQILSVPTEIPATFAVETVIPTSTPTVQPSVGISFANDVLPILRANCSSCHGGSSASGGFSINSYQSIMTGSQSGPVIVAGDAQNSMLVQLVKSGQMPRRGPKLSDTQIQIITDWINTGVLDN